MRTWLPLGELTKPEVRERARALGLATADKPESQGICFVPDGDYAKLVRRLRPEASEPGDIVDAAGRVLGRHDGIGGFTVGQRRGLRIGGTEAPLYVLRIDAAGRELAPRAILERLVPHQQAHRLALLQRAQHLGLQWRRGFPDFVEKESAAVGCLEEALFVPVRSRESALLVTE